MSIYYRIPDKAKSLHLILWQCEDICCCCKFEIRADPGRDLLWEGAWHCEPEQDLQDEMIEEVQEACQFYNIVPTGIDSKSIYEITGECKL